MSVNVRNNNIDGALRILRTQSAPTLSVLRDKKEYKKPGVKKREEKKKRAKKKRRKRERIRRGNENKEMSLMLLYIDIKKRSVR